MGVTHIAATSFLSALSDGMRIGSIEKRHADCDSIRIQIASTTLPVPYGLMEPERIADFGRSIALAYFSKNIVVTPNSTGGHDWARALLNSAGSECVSVLTDPETGASVVMSTAYDPIRHSMILAVYVPSDGMSLSGGEALQAPETRMIA